MLHPSKMKKCLHITLGFLLTILLCSMQNNADNKHTRAQRLLFLANSNGLFNDSSAVYLKQLVELAKKEELPYYQIQSHYMLGKHFLLRLETAPAKKHFTMAARLAGDSKEYELYGFAMDRLGITYIREELPDSALVCFQKAIDTYKTHQLDHRIWNSFHGISMVFQFKGDYTQARKYGDEALQSIQGLDEQIAETILLNYLMSLSSEFKQLDDYTRYLNRYLEKLDPADLGKEQMHLAAYFSTDSDPRIRVREISAAVKQLSGRAPTLSLLSGYYRLGGAHAELNQYADAIAAWTQGLALDRSVGGVGFSLAFTEALSDAYAARSDFKQALIFLKENRSIADSLSNLANTRKIDELQLKYETAEKEQTILAQQFEIERNTRQRNILLLVAALVLGLGSMIIYVLRTRLKAQKIIAEKEIQNLKQSNRLLTLNAMLRGQEEERKRIAFDLHDGLGGLLSTVKLLFQKLLEQHGLQSENGDVKYASQMLDEACSEVRRIAHNMMPHALLKMGIHAAIADMVNHLSRSTGIDIIYQNLSVIERLEESHEIMLYRVVQELVQNAIKHARPSSIIVQLSRHNGSLSLVVEDDGVGFNPETATNGLGLQSLTSRVEFLNGTIEIISAPGTGTTVSIDVPVNDKMTTQDLHQITSP